MDLIDLFFSHDVSSTISLQVAFNDEIMPRTWQLKAHHFVRFESGPPAVQFAAYRLMNWYVIENDMENVSQVSEKIRIKPHNIECFTVSY